MRTTRFMINLRQVRSKLKDLKPKYFKVLRAIKPKGLNRIVKICQGHPMPERENPSFIDKTVKVNNFTITTKQVIISHCNSIKQRGKTTYDIGNLGPCFDTGTHIWPG